MTTAPVRGRLGGGVTCVIMMNAHLMHSQSQTTSSQGPSTLIRRMRTSLIATILLSMRRSSVAQTDGRGNQGAVSSLMKCRTTPGGGAEIVMRLRLWRRRRCRSHHMLCRGYCVPMACPRWNVGGRLSPNNGCAPSCMRGLERPKLNSQPRPGDLGCQTRQQTVRLTG